MKNAWSESVEIGRFRRDQRGSVLLEFTITMWVFLLALFGIIEFSHLFYQWNVATKAVQHGARIAAVSDPVPQVLLTYNGVGGSVLPGAPMPSFDFTCQGSTQTCTNGGNYSAAAMNALVYGLNDTAGACTPDNPPPFRQMGMCDIFYRITPQNVIIRYQYTGLGYAGRPGTVGRAGGAVPTITVRLTGLNFNFYFLNSLLSLGPIAIPGLATTITGEDLNVNGN